MAGSAKNDTAYDITAHHFGLTRPIPGNDAIPAAKYSAKDWHHAALERQRMINSAFAYLAAHPDRPFFFDLPSDLNIFLLVERYKHWAAICWNGLKARTLPEAFAVPSALEGAPAGLVEAEGVGAETFVSALGERLGEDRP